jgi:hypothetical protein
MSLLLILIILLVLFGAGGFYAGGPRVGGGLGGLILIIIVVMALTGRLWRREARPVKSLRAALSRNAEIAARLREAGWNVAA